MSGSNWVAVVSVVFTSLTAGYATYENNQTNKELEKLKQEHVLSVEKLKQENVISIEKLKQEQQIALASMKSTQEREDLLQNRKFGVRTQYCSEAKSLYKDLGDSVINSSDRNIETRSTALTLTSKLRIQVLAYLDDGVYDNYIKQTKSSPKDSFNDENAVLAALAMQVRRCATMKPSDL